MSVDCRNKGEMDNFHNKLSLCMEILPLKQRRESRFTWRGMDDSTGCSLLLYVMGKEVPESKSKKTNLIYIDVTINNKKTRAMVDTRVTHEFVVEGKTRICWSKKQ